MGVQLNPDTYTGGGFLEEAFYNVKEARWVKWDYDKGAVERVFARLTIVKEGETEEHIQYWSAADPKDFAPSSDGRTLEQVGRKASLNDNSNWAELVRSLVNAGFDKSKMTDDIAALFEGGVFYFILQDAPERGGFQQQNQRIDPNTGQPYKNQIAVIGEIKQLPGEAPARQAPAAVPPSQRGRGGQASQPAPSQRPSAQAAPAPAPSNGAGDEEARGEAISFIMAQLADGSVDRPTLSTRVMQEFGSSPLRGKVMGLVNDKNFLEGLAEYGVVLDGTTLSIPVPA